MKYHKLKLKRKSERALINKAIRWLKELGVNPHISANNIVIKRLSISKSAGGFNILTGEIRIFKVYKYRKYKFRKYLFFETIAHELFHRADYLDKCCGTKKKRQEEYKKWEDMKEMFLEIEKYEKHMSADNPLNQAISELLRNKCDLLESLLKIWQKDPEKFKEMFKKAEELENALKDNKAQDKRIMDEINIVKEYFMQTPIKMPPVTHIFHEMLSEIPAYMLSTYIIWGDIKHGARIAKKAFDYKYNKHIRKKSSVSKELSKIVKITTKGQIYLIHILRIRGIKDKEILRTILNLHKNIYHPADVLIFVWMEKEKGLISRSVKAIKQWKGVKDVRIAIAAHHLGEIEEIFKKVMEIQHKEKENIKN